MINAKNSLFKRELNISTKIYKIKNSDLCYSNIEPDQFGTSEIEVKRKMFKRPVDLMNSSWVVSFKRKTRILCPDEDFFKLHSRATERKKDKIWVQKTVLQQIIITQDEFNMGKLRKQILNKGLLYFMASWLNGQAILRKSFNNGSIQFDASR
jgi:hypothetical protein